MKLLTTALALFIWSFSFGQDTLKTPTGLQIVTLEKGETQMPKVGQEVKVNTSDFL